MTAKGVYREPSLLVRLGKKDFFERPLLLAQLMLTHSMDTVTEGHPLHIYQCTYIHT